MKANQHALLTKTRRSVAAGRRLAADGDLDFAVSRAYYAMFYTAQAFLLGRERRFSKHSAVIAAFGQEFAKPTQCYGNSITVSSKLRTPATSATTRLT